MNDYYDRKLELQILEWTEVCMGLDEDIVETRNSMDKCSEALELSGLTEFQKQKIERLLKFNKGRLFALKRNFTDAMRNAAKKESTTPPKEVDLHKLSEKIRIMF